MLSQTLEQKRSKYAFEQINSIKGKNYEKDFSSLVSKIGTLILTNGLGNTLSFLFAKGKDHHLKMVYILSNWLLNESEFSKEKIKLNEDDIRRNIKEIMDNLVINVSTEEYIFYTEESLRLINWLRRFSDAMLEEGDQNE